MTFGKWLRDTRLDQDMTIRQFAKLVDLSAVTLCKLEGNKYEPGRYALHRLAIGLKKTYQEMRETVRSCEFVDY